MTRECLKEDDVHSILFNSREPSISLTGGGQTQDIFLPFYNIATMQLYADLNNIYIVYMFPSTKKVPFLSEALLWGLMHLTQSTDHLFIVMFSVGISKSRGNSDSHT